MRRDRPLFRAASNEPCIRRSRRRVLGRRSPASPGERVGKRRRGYESAPPVVGLRSGAPGADPALVGEIAQEPSALLVRPRSAPPPPARWSKLCWARSPIPRSSRPAMGPRGPTPATRSAPALPRRRRRAARRRPRGLVHEIGPSAIARTILLRLARLQQDAVPVAQAVAVLGESADLPSVAALGRDGRAPGRRPGRAGAPPGPAARAGRMIRTRAQQEALDAAVAAAVEKAGAGGLAR